MSNEQREKILQILYKERSNPLQVFDREDLAQQMGIPWHDIPSLEKDRRLHFITR